MKRLAALVLACLLTATGCVCASAEEDGAWTCPSCGAECTEDLCPDCGTERPGGEAQDAENDGKIRLDLEIAFEKNAYLATYDVKLYVDDEWIATMRNGVDYSGTVYVRPGKHAVTFRADSSLYRAGGSTVINIIEPSLYRCGIHAKISAVKITDERTETIPEDRAPADGESVIPVDGDLKLQVSVGFRKNGIFSRYNVDMYLDDTFIATLPHGKNFSGTLLVSRGEHILSFFKSGSKKVRGTCSFRVERDAYFSCVIEAERNRVDVRNDKLTQ